MIAIDHLMRVIAVCSLILLATLGCGRPGEQSPSTPPRNKIKEPTVKLHKVEQGNNPPDKRGETLVELRRLRESEHVRELDRRLSELTRVKKRKTVLPADNDRVVEAARARESLKSAVDKAALERAIADAERILREGSHDASN